MADSLEKWQEFYNRNALLIDSFLAVFYAVVLLVLAQSPAWLSDWNTITPLQFICFFLALVGPPAVVLGLRHGLTSIRFLLSSLLVIFGGALSLHWSSFALLRQIEFISPGWFAVFTIILPLLFFLILVGKLAEISGRVGLSEKILYGLVPLSAGGVLVSLPLNFIAGYFELLNIDYLTAGILILSSMAVLIFLRLSDSEIKGYSGWIHDVLSGVGITLGGIFVLTVTVAFVGSMFRTHPEANQVEKDPEQIRRNKKFIKQTHSFAEVELPEPADTQAAVQWHEEPPQEFKSLRQTLFDGPPALPDTVKHGDSLPMVMNLIKLGKVYSTARDYYLQREKIEESIAITSNQVLIGNNLITNERSLITVLVGFVLHQQGFEGIQNHLEQAPETRQKLWDQLKPMLNEDQRPKFLSGEKKSFSNMGQSPPIISGPWVEYKVTFFSIFLDSRSLGDYFSSIYSEVDRELDNPMPEMELEKYQPENIFGDWDGSLFIETLRYPTSPFFRKIAESALVDFVDHSKDTARFYTRLHCMLSLLAPEEVWENLSERRRTNFRTGKVLEYRDAQCLEPMEN
ncbi:MAG: hypothetical protein ACQEP7_05790 [bacterium]